MKLATTTSDFNRYFRTYEERIIELHRAGFRYIDLDLYSLTPDYIFMQDNWQEPVKRLQALADDLEMTFVQAHSQGGNYLGEDRKAAEFVLQSTLRSIEICGLLGIKNTVAHCGSGKGLSKEQYFEENKAFYSKMFPTMERCGVNVLCENSCEINMGGRYWINSGKDVREFVKYVDHPLFHACWDTGHGNCDGSQYNEILDLGDELYAIHYNDNQGKDSHMVPFLGSLNHDEVISALLDIGYKGYFTFECNGTLVKYNQWPVKRRRFEMEGKPQLLSQPQLFMQQHVEKLMYETGKWMLETYGLWEE